MALVFRRATAEDLAACSALCLRSKAHWGYDAAFMRVCAAELTLTAADIVHTDLALAERAGIPQAVAQVGPAQAAGRVEL